MASDDGSSDLPELVVPVVVPWPSSGRTFTVRRRVRWGDTDVTGRLRLDSTARYLQDVANDDTRDAGHDPYAPWVVRRTSLVVEQPVRIGEMVDVTTFSGGHGSRWADRRTTIVGDRGGRIEAVSVWVYVDAVTGRPAKLTPEFHATYDEAAAGRSSSARLRHDPLPASGVGPGGGTAGPGQVPGPGLRGAGAPEAGAGRSDGSDGADVDPGVHVRPWPLRSTDLDKLGHVNNAATWTAVEDELARRRLRVAGFAEIEYPDSIEPGDEVELRSTYDMVTGVLRTWLVVDGKVRASMVVVTEDATEG